MAVIHYPRFAKNRDLSPVVRRAIAEVTRLCTIGAKLADRLGLAGGETELQIETCWPKMPRYRLRVRDRWLDVPDGIGALDDEEIGKVFERLIREALA